MTPARGGSSRFGFLDGATIAARALGDWALKSGFGDGNVRVVTDDPVDGRPNPVDKARVQAAVDELFADGAQAVDHLVLAFCGHGLTDASFGAISWLFSDSLQQKYRVLSSAFYNEIALTGVKRITVITDACREAPRDIDLMRLDAARGVVIQGEPTDSPVFDLLAACQDGKQGYMLADPASAAPGKCLFSGVIADALWGEERSAIDSDGQVTTTTLAACVAARTTARALEYRLKINPQCTVGPVPAVLYDGRTPPAGPPGLQPWPAASAASPMGPPPEPPADRAEAVRNFDLLVRDTAFRDKVLGAKFAEPAAAGAPPRDLVSLDPGSRDVLHDLVRREAEPGRGPAAARGPARRRQHDAIVRRVEADAVERTRRGVASGVRRTLREARPPTGTEYNLFVAGEEVAAIWSREQPTPGRRTARREGWRVDSRHDGLPALVELRDGAASPVVPYSNLYAVVTRSPSGDIFQIYGQPYQPKRVQPALAAIADLAAGRIGPTEIDRLAAGLRAGKHADPILGALCAHLYSAVADVDSIRRMAWFYADHGQPVPFDVALLGDMRVERDGADGLALHIPEVRARSTAERDPLPDYVTDATPAAVAAVGGRCPWFALGWDQVGLTRPSAAALTNSLRDVAATVPRSGFTLLPAKAARKLAARWGLTRRAR